MPEVTLFKLLPQYVRGKDPDGVLKALCDAVQDEYSRFRSEITGIAVLPDVDRINQDYFLTGHPASTLTDLDKIHLPVGASDLDDYYVGKWVRVFGGPCSVPIQTRRIIAYDGTTHIATLDEPWGLVTSYVNQEYQTRTSGTLDTDAFVSVTDNGSIVPGSLVAYWASIANPDYTPLMTGNDNGLGVIKGENFSGTVNYTTGALSLSRVTGGDITDSTVRVNYAYRSQRQPPDTTSMIGLLHAYVSLEYMARTVGFVPEATDPDVLIREQIKNAITVSKLRGTERSFELLLKTLGFESSVLALWQNYYHAPEDVPGVVDPPYQTSRLAPAAVYVPREAGEDEVRRFLADNPSSTIGSSDIEVYVSRRHPDFVVTPDLIRRLRKSLDSIRPIHVEIALIGLIEKAVERVSATESLLVRLINATEEDIDVTESLFVQIGGYLRLTDAMSVGDGLEIVGAARWDVTAKRWDVAKTRWDVGTVYFRG